MKKLIAVIVILILVSSLMTACSDNSKDSDYLYDWLTEHGTLVDGTCLQYAEIGTDGARFALCYDTNYGDNREWYVKYIVTDNTNRTVETQLTLFWDGSITPVWITVYGSDDFDDYYRCMEYFHTANKFTPNSPIERGDFSGSTVVRDIFVAGQGPTTITDDTEGLPDELDKMDRECETHAQESLCLILDWLKNSFCPLAKMRMSDFGYKSY